MWFVQITLSGASKSVRMISTVRTTFSDLPHNTFSAKMPRTIIFWSYSKRENEPPCCDNGPTYEIFSSKLLETRCEVDYTMRRFSGQAFIFKSGQLSSTFLWITLSLSTVPCACARQCNESSPWETPCAKSCTRLLLTDVQTDHDDWRLHDLLRVCCNPGAKIAFLKHSLFG